MRENRQRRRRRKSGCGLGIFKFIIFVLIIVAIGAFAGKSYFGSNLADKIKKVQYPIKYEFFVEKYSDKFELDKYLVFAVMRTESRFDKYAVSSADAKGLMQLTDETGGDCAKKLGIDDYSNDALFDPEINIMLGCYYLRWLLDRYEDTDTALAAYNGGLGNVDKWLSDNACVDETGKLVNIPFRETRNYVIKVKASAEMYKKLYGNVE